MLTARHAVDACRRLYVVKAGNASPATVRVEDRDADVAVLGTRLKPILSATFPIHGESGDVPIRVFAEGYSALQTMPDRERSLFNAVLIPGKDRFSMMSSVRPGARGSAVLDADGFVRAMVVERTSRMPGRQAVHALSRSNAGTSLVVGGSSEVNAVLAQAIKSFLRRHSVDFDESHQAQLGRGQASAPRAATISVGVICER